MIFFSEAEGDGLHIPGTYELFEFPNLLPDDFPIALNKTGLLYILAALIAAIVWMVASRKQSLVPKGIQNMMEAMYNFIHNNIVVEVMGNDPAALRYVPFLATTFSFILVANLFEVFPLTLFPPTSRMAFPLMLAFTVWVIYVVQGIISQGFGHYFGGVLFPAGVPKALYLLLTPIELVSVFVIRPLTLAIRLFANMVAGHTLVTLFLIFSSYTLTHDPGLIPVFIPSFAGAVAFMGFEIFVSFIQAFIFTILSAVYIAESIHGH